MKLGGEASRAGDDRPYSELASVLRGGEDSVNVLSVLVGHNVRERCTDDQIHRHARTSPDDTCPRS